MSGRNSENTEQLSTRARCLLNQEIKRQQTESAKKDSLEKTSQEAQCAGRISVNGARRRLRDEWAELKAGDTDSPLTGVVAYVCVRKDDKAVALRAALMAMGASVALEWSVLVTHLIWQPGADSNIRVNARRLNAYVLSPKWVMSCAESCTRIPERNFSTPSRPSDPLDPHALTRILKIAEKENIPLLAINEENYTSLSSDSGGKMKLRLRISTSSRNTSQESSKESLDKSDTSLRSVSDTHVNTAPRKVQPEFTPHKKPLNSRRKLFTGIEDSRTSSESDHEQRLKCQNPYDEKKRTIRKKREKHPKNTQKKKKPTILKNISKSKKDEYFSQKSSLKTLTTQLEHRDVRIVLTSMDRKKREELISLTRDLPITIQKCVSSRTTHVVCGDNGCRTLNALCGTVRGCWIVTEKWLYMCADSHSLVQPHGYQVDELMKVSKRARIERAALQMRSYAMLIFADMRVRVRETAENYKKIITLLQLCGAVIVNDEAMVDITIGGPGDALQDKFVPSRWVSDSIVAGRPRNTKKYTG